MYDGREVTQKARDTYRASFEDLVDPGRILPGDERARRVKAARHAHFVALAFKASMARSKKKKDADPGSNGSAFREMGGATDGQIRHDSAD